MAIKCTKREWCAEVGDYRCEFVMDSAEDVADLPECCPGSQAVVMAESFEGYAVNASGEWKKIC